MIIGNKNLIRDINTHNVLETIINKAPISRIDLTKQTGLTKGTISTLVQNLIDRGLVVETEFIGSGVGRKKLLLELFPNGGFCVSIDLQKNKMKLMSADLCGQKISSDTKNNYDSQNIFLEISNFIEEHYATFNDKYNQLIGISIAIDNEIKEATDYKILVKKLETSFNVPIHVFGRGHFAVLGENSYSTKKDYVIFIDNTNTITMGLINDGHLFLGKNSSALNLDNITVNYSSVEPYCEKKVYLNKYISLSKILDLASEKLDKKIDCSEFLHLFSLNNPIIQKISTNYIQCMAEMINNLIATFDTDIVIINCPIISRSDEIFIRLKKSLGENTGILYRSMLKEDAVIYGGVVYSITDYLKISSFKPSKCYFRKMKFV